MKRIYFTIILILLSGSFAAGQDHRLKRKADQLFGRLSYELAIPYYVRYLQKHGDEAGADAARQALADAYRLTHDYVQAAATYAIVVQQLPVEPIVFFHYGHALLQLGERDLARGMFRRYDANAPEINGVRDLRGENFMVALDRYAELMADSALVELTLMPFNTKGAEFGASPYGKGLIFASARDEGPAVVHDFNWLDTPFLNLFYTEKKKDSNEWKKPEFLKGEVNTRYHESNFTKLPGDSTFYFTRNSFYNRKKGRDEAGIIKLNIYQGNIAGQKTSAVKPFSMNNDNYSVTHPALSPDGKWLYFVSDMPGGAGGKDIYRCQRQGDAWGEVENIQEINTPGDEVFPFLHQDGTLYFSSDGHPGLGKLDIFSVRMEGNRRAVNMGYPINTAHDDFAFYLAENHEDGYLASNRPGGVGDDDIYAVKLKKPIIELYVLDARDRSPIGNARVEIRAGAAAEMDKYETDDYGYVTFFGAYNREYLAAVRREPFYDGRQKWTTETSDGQSSFRGEILLNTPPEVVSAIIIDDSTGNRLPGAKVEFVNRLNRDEVQTLFADKYGRVMLNTADGFDKNSRYEVYVSHKRYFSYSIPDYDIQRAMRGDTIFPLRVDKIVLNKPFLLENIHYDFDKWDILPESFGDLEKVALLMIRNPDIIVEMMSHTDCRGNDRYNQRLSQRRASSARTHLILYFGIDPDRVKARGYGEEMIANECHDGAFCTEPQHRANRRTEFRITGFIEGLDMENSILETDEKDDPTPQAGKSAVKARKLAEEIQVEETVVSEVTLPAGEKYAPGRSEELDTEEAVAPKDWPSWSEPTPVLKPETGKQADPVSTDVTSLPAATALPRAGVPDFTGDTPPSSFTLPTAKYHPNSKTFATATVFRICIGAFQQALTDESQMKLRDFLPYTFVVEGSNGMLVYYIAEYLSVADAKKALQEVQLAGFRGAYIIGFEQGKVMGPGTLREHLE